MHTDVDSRVRFTDLAVDGYGGVWGVRPRNGGGMKRISSPSLNASCWLGSAMNG